MLGQLSEERYQTVVFMRHGVARHNWRDPITGARPDLHDPALVDPPLLLEGQQGAIQVGERIRQWQHQQQSICNSQQEDQQSSSWEFELLVVSPLTRSIQTGVLAFLPGDYDRPHLPIVCNPDVREAYGIHYPDRRREKSLLMERWPQVHFDDSMTEADSEWKVDIRETFEDLQRRVQKALSWLVQRKETNIAVVTHGIWMEVLLGTYDPMALGHSRVYNLDTYACQMVSKNGEFLRIERTQHLAGGEELKQGR